MRVSSETKGVLIFLEPLNPEERKQINVWDKDPEVSKYREVGDFRKTESKNINFGIHDKTSSKLIGSIDISSIDTKNKHAEIGMAIGDKDYWSKGYGTLIK